MCIAVTAIAYLFMPNGAKEAAASDKAFYTGYISYALYSSSHGDTRLSAVFPERVIQGFAPALLADFAISLYRIYNDLR